MAISAVFRIILFPIPLKTSESARFEVDVDLLVIDCVNSEGVGGG
jgi:hypothetical protein